MKAALIIMTILGCDDAVTQCHYIDRVKGSWPSVAQCDSQSEANIGRYQNSNYPVVVAVCETNGELENADALEELPAPPAGAQASEAPVEAPLEQPMPTDVEQPGITSRTLTMLKSRGAAMKETMVKPFRYAEDGYSSVVRKFAN